MIDDPTDFQMKFHMRMLERMALRAMILSASHASSISDARQDDVAWLQSNLKLAGEIAGRTRPDAALAELYADEAREVIDDLIAQTNALAKDLETRRP